MDLLKDIIKRHFNMNYMSSAETILRELENPDFPNRKVEFKQQLKKAVTENSLSAEELENLTDDEFETQKEANDFLRNEVWKTIYGNEPIKI